MTLLPPQDLYSEILPGLWQGGTHDFDTLEFPKEYPIWKLQREFDSVATLYAIAHPVGWGVAERRYGFPDSSISEQDIPEIHDIAEWAHREWKAGKKVIIRCQAGLNRSGLIMALVLISEGYDPKDAIDLIRARRSPHALCNADFVRYLESLTISKANDLTNLTLPG